MRGHRTILNVAEKPSVAKEAARILSGGTARYEHTCSRYNGLYTFQYMVDGAMAQMAFTSVSGHLTELDFTEEFKPWHSCEPAALFTAPLVKKVPQNLADLRRNLERQARKSQWLILWLDCDREGENIAFEVMEVCLAAKPSLTVKRAKFSALIQADLRRAMNNLVAPNANLSAAVDARQEIDLRIGAAFTRFQTLLLQGIRNQANPAEAGRSGVISYGPCQFPTLGLIVQRTWDINAHEPEPYWVISLSGSHPDGGASCNFHWERERCFDEDVASILFERCTDENEAAIVVEVSGTSKRRQPPLPLSTLELQKLAVTQLRMSGAEVMKFAEELYQAGFISYPRTETDEFDDGYDIRGLVQEQSNDQRWGAHARAILEGTMWKLPAQGGHNDHAHPPIHPTKHTSGEAGWNAKKSALYILIVRCFLATCSKAAVGRETKIVVDLADDLFTATGLVVLQRNWLEVYPYTNWGTAELPNLQSGQTLKITKLSLDQAMTQAKSRITERELITLMEQNGIGTDATVAEHIQKQIDRKYATKDERDLTFWPTPLGEGLIGGYKRMGLGDLWLPILRSSLEEGISRIAQGQEEKGTIIAAAVSHFRRDLEAAQQLRGIALREMLTSSLCSKGILEREVSRFLLGGPA